MRRRSTSTVRRQIVLAVAAALALAGCGGGAGASSPITTLETGGDTPGAPGLATGPAASAPVHGHLGDKLEWSSNGDPFAATLVNVVDPATPTGVSGAAPAGQHWVGVEIVVSDPKGNPAEDSAATDAVGTDGQRYGSHGSAMAGYRLYGFDGCAAVAGNENGQDATDCSGFLVADGVTLASVGYGIVGVDIGGPDDATWSIP